MGEHTYLPSTSHRCWQTRRTLLQNVIGASPSRGSSPFAISETQWLTRSSAPVDVAPRVIESSAWHVPCCYSWQPDWGQSAGLTHHSILIVDPWSPCLPRTHEPRTGRRPVSFAGKRWGIDFPVVAAAPPRHHLVAPLARAALERAANHPSALPIRFATTERSRRRYNFANEYLYKTFVRLANGNDFCQPDLPARVP